ncbi:MarP family serine protease [Nonomuraea rhizosphaerae]|uniref:MarP family serine protease n=1 Tax=Nonomuraea rhizosphaerae TaxID=2665663 RepID=UPI001C5DCCF2|nr:MarP family serine protease [Nonomuraea rhizosphaerae]
MQGDLLDLILIALVIGFGVSGYRQGFITGVMSFVGFVGGCVFGIFIAPPIAQAVDGDIAQALLALVIVLVAAALGQLATSTLGAVVRSHLTHQPAKTLDAIGGSVVGALSVLVIAWLVGSLLVSSSFALVVDQIRGSALLTTVDGAMPEAARDWQRPFKQFIDRSDFPPVLDAIGGNARVDVPEPDAGILRGPALTQAVTAIVQVQGIARSCNKQISGTGFVYAPDHIMTNAHVVAGVNTNLQVIDHTRQPRPATVVHYNPQRDVAVLYVPGLNLPHLTFDGNAQKGDDAVIAGYPQDQGFTTRAARIAAQQTASSPDIYRNTQVTREVYLIRGLVQQGNSGGPLLTVTGRVFGVIFAAQTSQEDKGYVLTAGEVSEDARTAATATQPVSTQACD